MSKTTAQLSEHARQEIDRWLEKYPPEQKASAVLAALREVQHENQGYLTTELMDAVADYLGMPQVAVYEVASFYSMFETRPVGRHSISVCTNVSCMLNGSDDIVAALEKHLGIKHGETTADKRCYLKVEEECLAACCGAPMMMVDHKYYEKLTPESAIQIIEELD